MRLHERTRFFERSEKRAFLRILLASPRLQVLLARAASSCCCSSDISKRKSPPWHSEPHDEDDEEEERERERERERESERERQLAVGASGRVSFRESGLNEGFVVHRKGKAFSSPWLLTRSLSLSRSPSPAPTCNKQQHLFFLYPQVYNKWQELECKHKALESL